MGVAEKLLVVKCRCSSNSKRVPADLSDVNPSFQSEDGEKSVVYNTVGSNVCMGDHKVTVAHSKYIKHSVVDKAASDSDIQRN